MRLTNDGIKENGAWGWYANLPGSSTQHPDVYDCDADAQGGDITLHSRADVDTAMEVQYAMAVAGYDPTAAEMADLQERFPLLYGAPALAETVELNEQIAA